GRTWSRDLPHRPVRRDARVGALALDDARARDVAGVEEGAVAAVVARLRMEVAPARAVEHPLEHRLELHPPRLEVGAPEDDPPELAPPRREVVGGLPAGGVETEQHPAGEQVERELERPSAAEPARAEARAATGLVVDDPEAVVAVVEPVDLPAQAQRAARERHLERRLRRERAPPLLPAAAERHLERVAREAARLLELALEPADHVVQDLLPVGLAEGEQHLAVLGGELAVSESVEQVAQDAVDELAAVARLDPADVLRLLDRPDAQDRVEEVLQRAGRIPLETGRRQRIALEEAPLDARDRLLVGERPVVDREGSLPPARAAKPRRAARPRLEPEQRAVALDRGQRGAERDGARPSGREAAHARKAVDHVDGNAPAGDGEGGGAEERRRELRAASRLRRAPRREQHLFAGGVHGERELERLGVGAAGAQRQRPAAARVQPLALLVEQEGVLPRRRRERPLDEAEDGDGTEAQLPELVHVEDVHAAT